MKITKREYTKQMTDLTTRKNIMEAYIARLIANVEGKTISMEEADRINAKHDRLSAIEDEIRSLESRWQTRNWTGSDWNTYALIVQNID